eukprot:TRINITY_DN27_c0_g1_i1.p9 TRINITY_DN27_c0_g1~~TRINITY_DN27_c0_g1_i1.p9  ORF type:complete len:164 (+),score=7.64 TRINITY_DN27_c0_g1_i1:2438-2929(+)
MISSDSSLMSSSADFGAPSIPRIEFMEYKICCVSIWLTGQSPKTRVGLYIGIACCNPKTLAEIPRLGFRSSFLLLSAVSAVYSELPERFTSLTSLSRIMSISSVDIPCSLSAIAQIVRPTAAWLLKRRFFGDLYMNCAVCLAVSLLWQRFTFLLPIIFAAVTG